MPTPKRKKRPRSSSIGSSPGPNGRQLGLKVSAGHGLNYHNIKRFPGLEEIEEYSIGHSIIARAVYVGLEQAVRDMVALIEQL